MVLENYRVIKKDRDNYVNQVWGSIDPRDGEIVLYSSEYSIHIEKAYQNFKKNKDHNKVVLTGDLHATIVFKNIFSFYQSTGSGYRDVFREEIDHNYPKKLDEITLVKNVYCCNSTSSWYLKKPKITHIGFFVDKSASMIGLYKNIVEKGTDNFLKEQRTLDNNVLFYGSTFNQKMDVHFNGVDLKSTNNIKDTFMDIDCRGSTAYYDTFSNMIKLIEYSCDKDDEIILCGMTDGDDNMSKISSITLKKMITDKKKSGWIIVMFGTEEVDIEKNSIGLSRDCCLEIGKSESDTRNAYHSLNIGLNRVRETRSRGRSSDLKFTTDERTISNSNRIK